MNKRTVFTICLVAIITFSVFLLERIGCSEDIIINNYEAVVTFNDDGSADIEEKYYYSYKGHYVAKYRDIETNKYNPENPIAQSREDVAKLIIPEYKNKIAKMVTVSVDGVEYPSHHISEIANGNYSDGVAYVGVTGERDEQGNIIGCEPSSSTCESIFVYLPSGFGEETVFTYKYKIEGIVTKYNDIASFNWKMFEYNEGIIKKGTVKLVFPENQLDSLRCWARGANQNGEIVITSSNQVDIAFDTILKNVALEIRALADPQIFGNIQSKNTVSENVLDEIIRFEEEQAEFDNIRLTVSRILYFGTFVIVGIMTFVIIHVYKKYDKEHVSEFDGDYLRELPNENLTPAEVSFLYYFGKINDEDATATLLDLVRKKYLKLDTNNSGINDDDPHFLISVTDKKDYSQLKAHEVFLINWFIGKIGNGTSVTVSQIEEYCDKEKRAREFMADSKHFVDLCVKAGKTHKFIESVQTKAGAYKYLAIPVIYLFITVILQVNLYLDTDFAIICNILLIIGYLIYVGAIKKRTKYGANEFAKWNAFKNFLEDFGEMKDYPMPGLIIWEKYLVYATSFKIADKVMEQLKVRLPEVPKEVIQEEATFTRVYYNRRVNTSGYYNWYYFSRINNSFKVAKQTSLQTIAKAEARRASGSGRGGGFSGGSSFGGGGGGGRSR